MGKNIKPKKKHSKKSGWFFIIAVILFLLVYLGVSFMLIYGDSVTTYIVKNGTEEDLIYSEGYIFKDSEIVTSTEAGYIDCLKEDDEKVGKGEAVVNIYKNEVDAGLKKEILDLTQRIEALEETIKYKGSYNENNNSEQAISEEIKKIGKLSDKGNIEGIYEVKKNINTMLLRGRESDDKSDEQELENLKAQLSELTARQNEEAATVYAESSGIFISKIDGSEALMSLSDLEENGITDEKISEIEKFKPESKLITKVNAGEAIGKIVDNFKWVLAVEIPVKQSELLSEGQEVYIRFSDSGEEPVNGTITSISDKNGENVILLIESNKYSKTVYRSYKSDVQLILNTYSGIKVPQEALRVVDGKKGVYVLRGELCKFIPVDIKYSDENWVIVSENDGDEALKLYDEVIVKGKNLYDEKVIK